MIDMRSDTVTQPCAAMKQAMINAPLGDDVLGDDPTILQLEETIADKLGKESAIFVPSGTMANQIAIWLQSKRGDSIAVQKDSHIFNYEAGGPAVLSSVMMRCVGGSRGLMDTQELQGIFPPDDPHFAPLTLVCAEDTANKGGGSVHELSHLDRIAHIAAENHAKSHLDGARLFNAQVQSGISAARRAQNFDTVSICFSKGLGCPVGSALCLPKELQYPAKKVRKVLGGGMRQAGMLAAAALFALEHNIDRLAEDHHHIQLLAKALMEAGYTVRPAQSNMVYFDAKDANLLIAKLKQEGILMLTTGPNTIRAVCHKQISAAAITKTIEVLSQLSSEHGLNAEY